MLSVFLLSFFLLFLAYIFRERSSRGKGYWTERGIPEIDPSSVVTEMDVMFGRKDITERDDYAYKVMETEKMSFCGIVESTSPIILVKDVELIKKVLIKDFSHFTDRRPFFGAAREDSVLRKMIGHLRGDEWKRVRASVTPIFSSGKIRRMIDCIEGVGLQWMKQLNLQCSESDNGRLTVNVFQTVQKYTADVIASAIFGLESETVQNPNSMFSTMANRLIDMNTFQNIRFMFSLRFPKLFQFFNIDILDMEAMRFFEVLLKEKLELRMKQSGMEGDKRSDFLQLLVEASRGDQREILTEQVMSGQCLAFFFAGFRTTSHFISFVLYALALHPEIQTKLREEVAGVFKENVDGISERLDYDSLVNLEYMDMVFCETLRKFPAALRLERTCVAEYYDPETGLRVPKGTIVGVPLHSLHHDTRFYERPYAFYPEHFTAEKKAERSPYAFMPFGSGPRNCIGARFALAMAHILHRFNIKPTDTTPTPLRGRRINFQIFPPRNLELALIRIQKNTS